MGPKSYSAMSHVEAVLARARQLAAEQAASEGGQAVAGAAEGAENAGAAATEGCQAAAGGEGAGVREEQAGQQQQQFISGDVALAVSSLSLA